MVSLLDNLLSTRFKIKVKIFNKRNEVPLVKIKSIKKEKHLTEQVHSFRKTQHKTLVSKLHSLYWVSFLLYED